MEREDRIEGILTHFERQYRRDGIDIILFHIAYKLITLCKK